MTAPLQPGPITYFGDFTDYTGFGGVHSQVDPSSGACTVQGGFTTLTGRTITPGTEMKIGWVADPTGLPLGSAVHTAPAVVRVGNRWFGGVVRVYNDPASGGHPGTIGIQSDAAGIVTECSFTISYPTIQD